MRRVGRPGLVGTVARTAVIAGTATAVSNKVSQKQYNKAEQQAEAQAYQQQQAAAAAFIRIVLVVTRRITGTEKGSKSKQVSILPPYS